MQSAVRSGRERQRAPSERAVATREKILDAAETVFAANGFDGATLRDMAELAGVRVSLVHHHGESKEQLFEQTVARRAKALAVARLAALEAAKAAGEPDPEAILAAFFRPFLALAETDPRWRAYARLVAHVSADPRWAHISAAHFDPTAQVFIAELSARLPQAPREAVARGFVYAVSAMLAHLTSQWRVRALAAESAPAGDDVDRLLHFCACGLCAAAGGRG